MADENNQDVKETEKTVEKAADKPAVKSGKVVKKSYRTVEGAEFINPLTEQKFTGEASKLVEEDAWIKLQVQAEKLVEVVED